MRKSICLGIIAAGLLFLYGCATVQLSTACPASTTGVSFSLAGSTVGNQLLSMLSSGLGTAGLIGARQVAAAAPATTATMKYSYVPIFGADSGSLTCVQPAPPPTVITTGPPPQILR